MTKERIYEKMQTNTYPLDFLIIRVHSTSMNKLLEANRSGLPLGYLCSMYVSYLKDQVARHKGK